MASSYWSALGATGQYVHAIAFTRQDGNAVSLCSHELPIQEISDQLPACPDCSQKLRALIDALPGNSPV